MQTIVNNVVNYLKPLIPYQIDIAIILGSGLGPLADQIEVDLTINYEDIPHFPQSTVVGHSGEMIIGKLGNKKVLALKGRFHYYEGHDISTVVLPIRVMASLGIKNLIVTNACGGISDDLNPGDIMLIRDHISFFCPSPLRGENFDDLGPRFPDMSDIYTKEIREKAKKVANELNIEVKEGVYAYFPGPMYETPTEILALKTLGSSVVGMSTVPEAIVARHAKMNVLGISLITNKAAGLGNQQLSHQEVMDTAKEAEAKLLKLTKALIEKAL